MTGFVYAISDGQGRVKIGWSSDPFRRLNKIASDCSSHASLVGIVRATKGQEREAHDLLAPWRANREWFYMRGPVLAFVDALHKPIPRAGRRTVGPDDSPLLAWRKTNKITLAQISKLIGARPPTINRWEKGIRVPRPRYMRRITELTGLSPSAFYAGDE